MLMVIISHLEICPVSFKKFFSPFALTGFFIFSGYVYKKPENFVTLLKKKLKTILFPWLLFSIVDIIELFMWGNKNISLIERIIFQLIQIKGLNETLWFLPYIFVSFIPFYFFTKNEKNIKRNFILQFILCTLSLLYSIYINPKIFPWKQTDLPWHIDKVFIATFFMTIGYILRKNNEIITKIQNIKIYNLIILLIGFFAITNIAGIHGIDNCSTNSVVIWYFLTIIGNIVLLGVSMKISNKLLLFVGKNSLLYFCLQGTCFRILNNIIEKLGFIQFIMSSIFIQYIISFILTSLIVLILILPIKFINKHMKFVLGKF